MAPLELRLLDGDYAIHRLSPSAEIPEGVLDCGFYSICRTDGELSIVCPSSLALNSERCDKDWACIKLLGPLNLDQAGILAKLSTVLADAQISIFALSTYDTDYILVKAARVKEAVAALEAAGCRFT